MARVMKERRLLRVSRAWHVALPPEWVRELGLKPGDKLIVEGDTLRCRCIVKPAPGGDEDGRGGG